MGSSIVGFSLFQAGRIAIVRVLGGTMTLLWLLASPSIAFAALHSEKKHWAQRWLMPRKGFPGGRKAKVDAVGDLSSISWACVVFCLANLEVKHANARPDLRGRRDHWRWKGLGV
ncbi:hypothetical protein BJ875DRAFT_470384 [Amylocarpus encephaloides]|uniref:Uncharacterized protein n=1 Tax=Amylocarpus encephaloides TaxID=45428 RepID=A0A9P7YDE2_9HELO|nr:hypothetical protein BJ875DRAFT_470384 [Amylocarpus encephaloides]